MVAQVKKNNALNSDGAYKSLAGVITTSDGLAKCFGLTRPRIIQLYQEGILSRVGDAKYPVQDNILAYIKYIEKDVKDKDNASAADKVEYWEEKGKHEKAKRILTEIALAKKQGEIHDAKDVYLVMTEIMVNLRTKLQGFPAIMATRLEGKSREEISTLMSFEVEKILGELSDYNPTLFDIDLEEAEDLANEK